jgi:hypothetical protein
MTALYQTIRGHIVYLKEGGREWGREAFCLTAHACGRSVQSAMELDDFKVFREANWSLSAQWQPRDGFLRETVDGSTVAHNWYRVDGSVVECEGFTRQLGRISQRLDAGSPIGHLGLHTIVADCMVAAVRGVQDPGVEKKVTCVTSSVADYGLGGYAAYAVAPLVTYLGCESIEVRAGRFEAEHFMVRWSDFVPAYSHFWVLREHFLPLRLKGASGPVSYELAAIDLDGREPRI